MSKAKLPTPHKLPSVGVSRDDFETWWHFVTIYCQQNQEYCQFYPGGKFSSWTAETRDATRGITIEPEQADADSLIQAALDATAKTNETRLLLSSLLTTIAAFCPEGTFKPVLSESTSILWIKDRIAKVCKIQTTGRHLPKILNIKWDSEKDTPDAFFLKIRSSFQDSLMPAGTKYHGSALTTPETLGPLTESIIVIKWLEAIHPALPNYIMENRGDLFTDMTPNFCDIQPELCNIMDSLIAKVQETEYNASRISVKAAHQPRPGRSGDLQGQEWGSHNSVPSSPRVRGHHDSGESVRLIQPRQNTRLQPTRKPQAQQPRNTSKSKEVCDYCVATGKEERVWSTHSAQNCFMLFPDKRRTKVRMISIPVETDENDQFSLSDAVDTLTESYQNLTYDMPEVYEQQ